MVLLMALEEDYRNSFIRNNRAKKISSEPDAAIKRATSGSRATCSRPLVYSITRAIKVLELVWK